MGNFFKNFAKASGEISPLVAMFRGDPDQTRRTFDRNAQLVSAIMGANGGAGGGFSPLQGYVSMTDGNAPGGGAVPGAPYQQGMGDDGILHGGIQGGPIGGGIEKKDPTKDKKNNLLADLLKAYVGRSRSMPSINPDWTPITPAPAIPAPAINVALPQSIQSPQYQYGRYM